MNKKELSQLYSLNKEIEQEKKRLADLEVAEAGIAVDIKGIPYIGIVSDKTVIAKEIADCKAVIDAKVKASIAEYNRLNRYIASIDNSSMRQVLTLRFVDGLSWNQVACGIGGGNTADSVRKACERFLNEN